MPRPESIRTFYRLVTDEQWASVRDNAERYRQEEKILRPDVGRNARYIPVTVILFDNGSSRELLPGEHWNG